MCTIHARYWEKERNNRERAEDAKRPQKEPEARLTFVHWKTHAGIWTMSESAPQVNKLRTVPGASIP